MARKSFALACLLLLSLTDTFTFALPQPTATNIKPTGANMPTAAWPADGGGGAAGQGIWLASIPEWVLHIPKNINTVRIAHAVLAASAFLLFFPLGGIILRVWDPQIERYHRVVWVHAIVQGFGYIVFVSATGMGIYMAKHLQSLGKYHPVIGMCLVALLALQPLTELLNHYFYDRYPRIVVVGHVHVWLGRLLLLIGIVNGGLGFHFAESFPGPQWPQWPKIAYGAIATVVFILYVAIAIVWRELRENRAALLDEVIESGLRGAVQPRPAAPATGVDAGENAGSHTGTAAAGSESTPGPDAETKKSFRSSAL